MRSWGLTTAEFCSLNLSFPKILELKKPPRRKIWTTWKRKKKLHAGFCNLGKAGWHRIFPWLIWQHKAQFLVQTCTTTKNQYPTKLIHPERNKNDTNQQKKTNDKTCHPTFSKNGSHYQNKAISSSHLATPETSSSPTLSVSTPNTNQQQEQNQELKNRIIALESRTKFLWTQLLITQNVSKYRGKRLGNQ